MRRDASREDTVRSKGEAEYFSLPDWTTQISLNRLDKFDFWRTRFRADFRALTRRNTRDIVLILHDGQINHLRQDADNLDRD